MRWFFLNCVEFRDERNKFHIIIYFFLNRFHVFTPFNSSNSNATPNVQFSSNPNSTIQTLTLNACDWRLAAVPFFEGPSPHLLLDGVCSEILSCSNSCPNLCIVFVTRSSNYAANAIAKRNRQSICPAISS